MADLKNIIDTAGERAALATGKNMAERALEDLTLTPDEKAEREAARAAQRTKTLMKVGVVGVVGVVAVLSLLSVLASLWMYALGLLVFGGVGAAAYLYAKPKVKALQAKAAARLGERSAAAAAAAREQAARDAVIAKQQRLEDELAALKKRTP